MTYDGHRFYMNTYRDSIEKRGVTDIPPGWRAIYINFILQKNTLKILTGVRRLGAPFLLDLRTLSITGDCLFFTTTVVRPPPVMTFRLEEPFLPLRPIPSSLFGQRHMVRVIRLSGCYFSAGLPDIGCMSVSITSD